MDVKQLRQQTIQQFIYPQLIILGWADILTGFAISGALQGKPVQLIAPLVFLLVVAGLVSGLGAILAFLLSIEGEDTEQWLTEVIRSKYKYSIAFGIVLLSLTILTLMWISHEAAFLVTSVAITAFVHGWLTTKYPFYGLLGLAFYHASSILLGISIIPNAIQQRWYLVLIPVIYLAIAVLYEQKADRPSWFGELPIILLILVLFESLFLIYSLPGYDILKALLYIIILARQILPPYFRSLYEPQPEIIAIASNAFWVGVFLLDATLAAGFANWYYALLVLSTLPIARRASTLTFKFDETNILFNKEK